MLVNDGILYKKRGIGMFVKAEAVKKIRSKRKKSFYDKYVVPLLTEASNLNISNDEIRDMIKKVREK
jgi:DNA-binding transcriptional regulator YhcF (GntR family)